MKYITLHNQKDGKPFHVPINVSWDAQLEDIPASVYWRGEDEVFRAYVRETILDIKS